jgi:hypothetical protein
VFKLIVTVETVFDNGLIVNVVGYIAKGFVFWDMLKKILPVVVFDGFLVALMQLFFKLFVFVTIPSPFFS